MEVAAVLGIVGGNADKALEVLSEVTCEDIAKTKRTNQSEDLFLFFSWKELITSILQLK